MTLPTLVITSTPDWRAAVEAQLRAEFAIVQYTDPTGYVTRLADARAALVLVDGQDDRWRFWTSTPKSSPATRRIPIIVAADEAEIRRAALIAGADFALTPAELVAQIAALAREMARVEDPAAVAQLECECQESLPPLAVQGVEQFNAGEYYKQHDLFEEQWMHTDGPVRDLYRAILQVGIAYFQITRGNHRGALKMLLRSVQWLTMLPDVCQGVDVRQLREDAARVRAELETMDPTAIDHFDRSLLRPVRRVDPD